MSYRKLMPLRQNRRSRQQQCSCPPAVAADRGARDAFHVAFAADMYEHKDSPEYANHWLALRFAEPSAVWLLLLGFQAYGGMAWPGKRCTAERPSRGIARKRQALQARVWKMVSTRR